jgi:hypothetical protein
MGHLQGAFTFPQQEHCTIPQMWKCVIMESLVSASIRMLGMQECRIAGYCAGLVLSPEQSPPDIVGHSANTKGARGYRENHNTKGIIRHSSDIPHESNDLQNAGYA